MTSGAAARLSRYDEIVVRVAASMRPQRAARAPDDTPSGRPAQVYPAWIYTGLSLPVRFGEIGAPDPSGRPPPPPEIGGLPLIGREEISITWRRVADYLGPFYDGDRAVLSLQRRLVGALSGGLKELLRPRTRSPRRLRIWWSSEPPELDDLPWEIIALGAERPSTLSIVRGSPGRRVPPLPLQQGQPLRVAVIDPTCSAPAELWEALSTSPAPELEFVWIEQDDPRKALFEATRAGMEVVHLVADGSVPLGVEGVLEFFGDEEEMLSPPELTTMLRGSKVTILSLSPPEYPQIGDSGMPTAFHSFARVGHDSIDGPTIVAQLGPMVPQPAAAFWRAFYHRLAVSLDVEDAISSAARRPTTAPVALFLRHRLGRQFSRRGDEARRTPSWPTHGSGSTPEEEIPLTPAQVTADLSVSRELLDEASAVEARYSSLGLDFPCKDLIEKERRRQAGLSAALDEAIFEEIDHEDP